MATYYVSFTDGLDSRNSTQAQSSSTPWKTLDKISTSGALLQPGDQVLFKRGDTWREGNSSIQIGTGTYAVSLLIPSSGTSGNPIVFGAYGTGANPCFHGGGHITLGTNWTPDGSNNYHIARTVFGNTSPWGVESGWRTSGSDTVVIDTTGPSAGSGYGYMASLPNGDTTLVVDKDFYDDGTNIRMKCSVNPNTYAWEFSTVDYGIAIDGKIGITIQDIDVKCYNFGGIIAPNNTASYLSTLRCNVFASGQSGISSAAKHTTVDSCNVYSNGDTGIYIIYDPDNGTGETGGTDSIVTNNFVKYNGIYGGLYSTDMGGIGIQANRCTIANNWVEQNGPDTSLARYSATHSDSGISCWVANNLTITRNYIINSRGKGISTSGDANSYHITIAYNLIVDTDRAGFGWPWNDCIDVGMTGNNSTHWDHKIYNNTMVDKANRGIRGILIYLDTVNDFDYGTQIENNLLYSLNADSYFISISRDQMGPTTEGTPTPWIMDYNYAYIPNSTSHYISWNYAAGGGDESLGTWASSNKPTNCGGNQSTHDVPSSAGDPAFANGSGNFSVPATDYQLTASSPAVNTGTNVGYTTDILGNPVPA